jgi:hypothetical protein
MIPIVLALPLALAPFVGLAGSLGWMARSSSRYDPTA